jgi:triosephosphate isomerase
LVPIVCVGETENQRLAGQTLAVVSGQLEGSLPTTAGEFVVAYEPVWAIGTGRTPTLDDVAGVHGHIRALLKERLGPEAGAAVRTLYGGSVKAANAKELLALEDVDGALAGGASLEAEEFWAIGASCP